MNRFRMIGISHPWARTLLAAGFLLLAGATGAFARGGNGGGGDDGGGGGGGGEAALKLRLNPAIGTPGGQVAFVVRTYAARPIRQGQMTLRVRRRPPVAKALTVAELTAPLRPLLRLVSATVYSQRGDSRSQSQFAGTTDGQSLSVQFSSPSETINSADGPLAVFKFVLDPSAQPGDVYDVELDPALTSLIGAGGSGVAVQPLNDVLTVRSPKAPFAVEAEGDKVAAGAVAELGVNTFEPFPSAGGRVTFLYPAALAAGLPTVRIDPRYGKVTFKVDSSKPGRLVVDVVSKDNSFNVVPGRIVAISLPIKPSAAIGSSGGVSLDPAGTYLLTRKGRKVAIKIENGALEIR